jgi:hypothetical protein
VDTTWQIGEWCRQSRCHFCFLLTARIAQVTMSAQLGIDHDGTVTVTPPTPTAAVRRCIDYLALCLAVSMHSSPPSAVSGRVCARIWRHCARMDGHNDVAVQGAAARQVRSPDWYVRD